MVSELDSRSALRMHGYSSLDARAIKRHLDQGDDVSDLPGDFVVYDPSVSDGFAVSSFLSAQPYYYAVSGVGELIQGDNVFEVAMRAGVPWKWNERTVVSLGLFGHSTGADTLCQGVCRLPPATRVSLKGGQAVLEALPVKRFLWDVEASQDRARSALQSAFDNCVQDSSTVHLSLSAGFDSRLLLALCLERGITPSVSVMGYDDSTDVIVARAICERLGLRLQVVQINPKDYLKLGRTIGYVTSGVKTAINWHTYLYGRGKDFSKGIHLVGSNGEFARTFFFDKPRLDPLARHLPSWVMNAYWFARCARRAMKFSAFNPLIKRDFGHVFGLAKGASAGSNWSASRFLPALDAFYAEQRVRHFIGGGLACYAEHGSPRSPFLDARWMRSAAAMMRRFKQGSHFHATTTAALLPELAGLGYNQLPDNTTGRSYHPFPELATSNEVTELLLESSHLEQWTTRRDRLAVLSDSRCDQVEERNFWLTLHFASEALALSVSAVKGVTA